MRRPMFTTKTPRHQVLSRGEAATILLIASLPLWFNSTTEAMRQ